MLIIAKIKGFFPKVFNICGSSGFEMNRSNLRLTKKKTKKHPGFFPENTQYVVIFLVTQKLPPILLCISILDDEVGSGVHEL